MDCGFSFNDMDLQSRHTLLILRMRMAGTCATIRSTIKSMSEKGEVDLTGAKQNTGVWLVKVCILVF